MNDHPNAETLSAYLDGQAPEAEGHIATCAECRQELDVLARVRTAVAAPVPPPEEHQKDAAIAAAMDAAAGGSRPSSGRWRVVAVAGGIAAAIVVGLVATRVTTSHKSPTAASGPVSKNLVRAGDLGDVNDALALRQRIEPSLAPNGDVAAQAGPFGAAAGESGGGASAGSNTASPSATLQPVPPPVTEPSQPPRCEAQARKLDSKGAALVYEATARWQGTPADVFGFSPSGAPATSAPGRPTPTRVYVLARSDCHLLVFQSYAP